MARSYRVALSLLLLLGGFGTSASAQPAELAILPQKAKLISSDRNVFDIFGWSVDATESTAVVGQPGDSSSQSPGAVYVYDKPPGGWTDMTQTAKLTASDGFPRGGFGWSVAISGDTVVVGAQPNDGTPSKEIYVFVKPKTGWTNMTETARLTVSGPATNIIGESVAIDTDTIVTFGVSPDFLHTAVHVFVKPAGGWSNMHQTATLTDRQLDSLGWSLAIQGDTIVAGAPVYNNSNGAAYVFVKPPAGWATTSHPTARLTANDTIANSYMGYSVSFDRDTVVAGALGSPPAGSAYVFTRPSTGWANMTQTATLTTGSPGSPCYGDNFGGSVHIKDDVVLVGASLTSIGDPCSASSTLFVGSLYLYTMPAGGWKTTSHYLTELFAYDEQGDAQLGWSVSGEGTVAFAGAFYADGHRGAVYVFAN